MVAHKIKLRIFVFMITPITRELLLRLQDEGYTMLIAEGQADQDNYVFTPFNYNVEEFANHHITSDLEDDMILVIEEALHMNPTDLVNHKVILP